MVWYVDTSAFLKLVVAEVESTAMRQWVARHQPCWSSHLLATEAVRAATRLGIDDEIVARALDTISLVLPAASTFHSAASLEPTGLRSLDALHLAAALELGADLEGVVTYDDRLIAGARAASITVVSP
ncbi:MAG TPA: PIN domain-containing protein [Candidatus Micrarchaeia archaeon]|nr:PIN domain-containing protein [Candidatus Micrarchaeia archaeon]